MANSRFAAPDHSEYPSDGQLEHHVRKELASRRNADGSNIRVTVRSGIVYLEGKISQPADDADVRKAVLRVQGVIGVIDRLSVAPRAERV